MLTLAGGWFGAPPQGEHMVESANGPMELRLQKVRALVCCGLAAAAAAPLPYG